MKIDEKNSWVSDECERQDGRDPEAGIGSHIRKPFQNETAFFLPATHMNHYIDAFISKQWRTDGKFVLENHGKDLKQIISLAKFPSTRTKS